MAVSVCIATYDGSEYIREQISSILQELGADDELVVVDDCSSDSTTDIIERWGDERITLVQNEENTGHVLAFQRAILLASNEFIFLSDQDDIWVKGRLRLMLRELEKPGCLVVASHFDLFNSDIEHSWPNKKKLKQCDSQRTYRNIVGIFLGKMPYFGCAMAFRRELLALAMPFPRWTEAHDLWLAILGNIIGGMRHLESPTLFHRVHQNNKTPKARRHIKHICRSRLILLTLLFRAWCRRRRYSDAVRGVVDAS